MLRRTTLWWTGAHRYRRPRRTAASGRAAVIGAVLCATALPPAVAARATGTPVGGYSFADGTHTVVGARSTADAVGLEPGETYRSSLPENTKGTSGTSGTSGTKLSYRIKLDAASTAYIPVTAVPPADTTVAATDGIRVSLRDAHGTACSYTAARFGASLSPRPVTALGVREAGKTLCEDAGIYYLFVERLDGGGSGRRAASGSWTLEIAPIVEPRLAEAGPTNAPEAWDSASPEPVTGDLRRRDGGAGFADARALGGGAWRTDIEPGQTLFYKVPVDWGQQLYASAELSTSNGDRGYVSAALDLSLYNPVRGPVDDAARGYTGRRTSAVLAPLPPVEYRNRYAVPSAVRAMRFAGSYYLALHLAGQTADTFGDGPYGLTLRVRVAGSPHAGPGYAGTTEQRELFQVTAQDRAVALTGATGGGNGAMKAVAAVGIGTGTALLLLLAAWTVVARRRAGAQIRASAQNPTA